MEAQDSQAGEQGYVGGISSHMAYISTPHLVLLAITVPTCKGLHTCFWEEGREGFFISLLSSLPQDTSTYFIIGFLQEERERMICHQPYFMDKETKGEWLHSSPERQNNQHKTNRNLVSLITDRKWEPHLCGEMFVF